MVSEAAGGYRFPGLVPGNYYLRAELTGFTLYEVKTVVVNIGSVTDVNVMLEPKGTQETITVNEVTPLVETTKTDIGGVVDNREVSNAPLNGRNFSDLAALMPGSAPVTAWDPTKTRIGAVSIAGASGRNVNTTVDGIDNKDNSVGGWVQNVATRGYQGILPQDATVLCSRRPFSRRLAFDRDQVRIEQFPWNLVHTFPRRDPSTPMITGRILPASASRPYSRWQYGGSFGGPVVKDKLFFFFTYERMQENASTIISTNTAYPIAGAGERRHQYLWRNAGTHEYAAQPFSQKLWTARADWVINSKNNFYFSWNNSWNNT